MYYQRTEKRLHKKVAVTGSFEQKCMDAGVRAGAGSSWFAHQGLLGQGVIHSRDCCIHIMVRFYTLIRDVKNGWTAAISFCLVPYLLRRWFWSSRTSTTGPYTHSEVTTAFSHSGRILMVCGSGSHFPLVYLGFLRFYPVGPYAFTFFTGVLLANYLITAQCSYSFFC